jgi:phage-related protein
MSGWNSFVNDVLKPIANAPGNIIKEGISDINGVYSWGKNTVSNVGNHVSNAADKTGNLVENTLDKTKDLENSATDLFGGIANGLKQVAETPYLLIIGVAVGGVVLLNVLKK